MTKRRRVLAFCLVACLCAGRVARSRAEEPLPPLKPGESIENIYSACYLVAHGWRMPHPPYPDQARILGEKGLVYLHVVTDKTGQVVKTTILNTPLNTRSKTLRKLVLLWALYKWSGPPNASTNVAFEFVLN